LFSSTHTDYQSDFSISLLLKGVLF
jgi:GTPase SAR1 family protein